MIVDDHEIVVDGLERVLDLDGRVEVVARADSLAAARALLKNTTPEVVLLDLRLPDSQDLNAIAAIRDACPEARIVVLTGYGSAAKQQSRKLGADAFLTKEVASDVIAQTVCDLFPERRDLSAPHEALSAREHEVARLVAEGLTNDEIAEALFISRNTVKTHLANVLQKLGLRDRVNLAVHWKRK